ncbi:MAG: SAM-dependent methyltransferase [Cyclobacteriaceae bacterium]
MMQGNLYLIPTYLASSNEKSFVSPIVIDVLKNTKFFLVENVRTARRFISSMKAGIVIDELQFEVLDKKTSWDDLYPKFEAARNGSNIGLMSEAGLPCLADPGNLAVGLAHQTGVKVVPLPGSSSIQLALIASGFNGQLFTFNGYLPIDRGARIQKVKELEKLAARNHTQIFMETPYRNHQLVEDVLKNCSPNTMLSVAANISGTEEKILTQTIEKWKKTDIQIHKIPAIFSFGQFS